MEDYDRLKKIGENPDSYFFTKKELREKIKINIENKIICKLPEIFTDYEYIKKNEENAKINLDNNLIDYKPIELKKIIFDQIEKNLCENFEKNSLLVYFDKKEQSIFLKKTKKMKKYKNLHIFGKPQFLPKNDSDRTLGFESRFESGNLKAAYKIKNFSKKEEYELFLREDYFNKKYTNWFFFRVYNTRKNVKYRFIINNMSKPKSLFNEGMRILFYSKKKKEFFRSKKKIVYLRNHILNPKTKVKLHSLIFDFKLPFDNDTVYISLNLPYTFSRVLSLEKFLLKKKLNFFFEKKTLCKTISKNDFNYYLIKSEKLSSIKKKIIIFGSRVHPGETPSSFVFEKLLLLFFENNEKIFELKKKFDFYFFPMLNIDGVVSGNYRVNLNGFDLNRVYDFPKKNLCPTIFYYKNFILELQKNREIFFFLDIHGHSKKFNVFLYANPMENLYLKKNNIEPENFLKKDEKEIIKSYSHKYLKKNNEYFYQKKNNEDFYKKKNIENLIKNNKYVNLVDFNLDFYSKKDTTYTIKPGKLNSARVVMNKQLKIQNSFTLEISYCGINKGKYKNEHFTDKSFKEIAEGLIFGLFFLDKEVEGLKEVKVKSSKEDGKFFKGLYKELSERKLKIYSKFND